MPLSIGTALGLGANVAGLLFGNDASSNAASEANAANQAAINEAKVRAAIGYGQNTNTIKRAGGAARGYIDKGFDQTTQQYAPLIADGDRARGYYNNATGVNGEVERRKYIEQLLARPEYAAAREASMGAVKQQFGSKLGSGAFARALQKRDMEFANTNIDRDLSRVKPVVDAGNQARNQQAQAGTVWGSNQASNEWKTGNADINNENAFSDNMMNAALSSGASNASLARSQGQSDSAFWSGIASAAGSAFGGAGGVAKQPFSSIFS